jgi:hypothetical protein
MGNYEESVKNFQASIKRWQDEHDKVWMDLPDNIKLACADVIFRAIDQHARKGETYRQLIYDRLGLNINEAYTVLQCAGALALSDNYNIADTTGSAAPAGDVQ